MGVDRREAAKAGVGRMKLVGVRTKEIAPVEACRREAVEVGIKEVPVQVGTKEVVTAKVDIREAAIVGVDTREAATAEEGTREAAIVGPDLEEEWPAAVEVEGDGEGEDAAEVGEGEDVVEEVEAVGMEVVEVAVEAAEERDSFTLMIILI